MREDDDRPLWGYARQARRRARRRRGEQAGDEFLLIYGALLWLSPRRACFALAVDIFPPDESAGRCAMRSAIERSGGARFADFLQSSVPACLRGGGGVCDLTMIIFT